METFKNDSGEEVIIVEMDKWRLVHSIAKYAKYCNHKEGKERWGEVVKTLKAEAIRRMGDD